ncbi:MAG: iron-sulfur cluster assembly accessory protein [Alphaproteobacteria bacterium]|nr:iron-sulfur cluster assembly accessory protein [Alphaproteobacteria bacterium]
MQPINITDNAAGQIKKLLSKAPAGTLGVRLNVKPRGCSGNSYQMEYIAADDTLAEDDKFEQDGAALYVPKIHSWMMFGITIDYAEDEMGNAKFRFKNPNEKGRCGCGESFYVEKAEENA